MMSRAYRPIIAAHEIRRTDHPPIRAGTSGEIIGISGDIPPHYCVTFWPSGRDRAPVTINHLTRIDLKDASAAP